MFDRFHSLKEPAKRRRDALEESLRFHKFGFELDAELQWIKDHLPQASSTTLGQNLHQAQTLHKKHKKLEAEIAGHQPMIDKTAASGQALIDQAHPEKKKVIIYIVKILFERFLGKTRCVYFPCYCSLINT